MVGLNNPGKIFLTISAVIAAAQLLCAGELDERKLGDRAFFADDYSTAISHYRSARKLSEDTILSDAWAQNTLRLGKAQLFAGDLPGAKQTLNEFRRRNPLRSAGVLPADILAAEGKYDEAEKLYLALESSGSNESIAAARFGRGALALKMGRTALAEEIFSGLAAAPDGVEDPAVLPYRTAACRELIYTLIRQEKIAEARKRLDSIPEKQRNVNTEILNALADIASGDLKKFKNSRQQIMQRQLRQKDARSYELLVSAAALAEKQNEPDFSIELLKAADDFAPAAEQRRDIFKRLINLQRKSDPEGAAETARNYFRNFPESSDRYTLLMNVAAILADAGRFTSAAGLLKELTLQRDIPQDIRCRAAADGAVFAEKSGDNALAENLYQTAGECAPDASALRDIRCKYADFLIRSSEFKKAVLLLEKTLDGSSTPENQQVCYQLLDAAVMAKESAVVKMAAQQLTASENQQFRGRAYYELGDMASAAGDYQTARKEFLNAAAVKSAGKYAVAGQFGAALMAFKLGDYRSAGNEALQLAGMHPELPQAHQAIFLGYQSARQLNDEKLKKECSALLSGKYGNSESYAVYALQTAADRANWERDYSGAAADLEELEKRFEKNPAILTEAMFMRAGVLKNSGKKREALEIVTALLTAHPECRAAYNAAMLAGELHFSGKNPAEALKFFRLAAALRTDGLEHDLAAAGIAEIMLRQSVTQPGLLDEALLNAEKFIGTVKFPPLRLKLRYYRAWALEHAGKLNEALAGYELLINEALELRAANIPFDRSYCVRGAAAALQIINSGNRRSNHIRGLRLVRQCRVLNLDQYGLDTGALQNELIKKLSSKSKRRAGR